MRIRRNGLGFWALALGGCLALAYWASIPIKNRSADKVAVVNLDIPKINNVTISSPDLIITASRRQDLANRWWIELKRMNSHEGGKSLTTASLPAQRERFMASAKFDEMLALLSPFQAIRIIGKLAADQLKEFGLDDSGKTLLVKDGAEGVLLSLKVGKQLYGSRNVYVMNQADQNVLLVSGDFINDFEKPELRAFERAITGIPDEEIQSATVTMGGKSRKFSHLKRDSKGGLLWASEEGEASPVAIASSWFERFGQLKAAAYGTSEEQAQLNSSAALFEVGIVGAGSAAETIQVRKFTKDSKDEYWLTSNFLGWHVKVATTRAESLVKDLPQLLGQ